MPAEDRTQQSAFTRSVGAKNGGRASTRNVERQITQRRRTAVADGDMVEPKYIVRGVGHVVGRSLTESSSGCRGHK